MSPPAPAGLKILMLHGYTQSGPLFRAKTRALEKALVKAFPGTTLSYPTAPIPLDPSTIPGFTPTQHAAPSGAIDAFAWWRRRDDAPVYDGLDRGLAALAAALATDGPFDGAIGFSQGGAAAGMLAALLDGRAARREAFAALRAREPRAPAFPAAFVDAEGGLTHPPLKFVVVYSGFAAPPEVYGAFYGPKIGTPSLHVFGGLDTVVAEERGQRLVAACEEASREVLVHPGGHFVPSQRVYLDAVVGFVGRCCRGGGVAESAEWKPKQEESVEEMDVPF